MGNRSVIRSILGSDPVSSEPNHSGKTDTFVRDFGNDVDSVRESFTFCTRTTRGLEVLKIDRWGEDVSSLIVHIEDPLTE